MRILKFWLPVLLWAFLIFTLSSNKTPTASTIYWQEFAIKKCAHLFVYSILFTLLYRAFLNTTKLARKNAAIFALGVLILYAISDEFHQSFTPGREPTVRDVIIDTIAGVLSWIYLWKLLLKAPKKLKNLAKILQIN